MPTPTTFFSLPVFFQDQTALLAENLNADFTALLNAANLLQSQINNITGGGTTTTLNGLSGAVSLVSNTISITPSSSSNTIDIEFTASGGGVPGFFASTMVPGGAAATNTTNLRNDVANAIAKGGGTILLPPGICDINGTINIGNGTAYTPVRITSLVGRSYIRQNVSSDVFVINLSTPGASDIPGMQIDNFEILYTNGATAGAAIRINACQHVRINQMTFVDCPVSVALDSALKTSITQFSIQQINNGTASGLGAITLGLPTSGNQAIETHISDGALLSKSTASNPSNPGGVGMFIQGVENLHMWDVRIEGYDAGIICNAACPSPINHKLRFARVYVESATGSAGAAAGLGPAFLFKPLAGQSIPVIEMSDCGACTGLQYNNNQYTGAGIVFDASNTITGTTPTFDFIKLSGCWAYNWKGPGLAFITANSASSIIQNIEVLGGEYVCNGIAGTLGNGAGVYFNCNGNLGIIQRARLHSATLSNLSTEQGTSATQSYGVAVVGGGTQGIMVTSCDFGGTVNTVGPLYTSGVSVGGLKVYNCNSYNDLNTSVGTSNIALNTQFDASTAGTTPYFGPWLIFFSGGTVTSIQLSHNRGPGGTIIPMTTSDGITMNPGQSMQINGTMLPTQILIYGQ